ncbi:MAG: Na+/H+ antiporter NhaA [Calditrichia bacterium]
MMVAAVLAMAFANSPLEKFYLLFLSTPVAVKVSALEIAKPLLLWINDGLMAVFFFLIGLELKREMVEGELSDKKNIILPGIGAVGGMLVPALIYIWFNRNDPVALQGWAIPAATDIAFALGILALIGSRVPLSLKLFLTSLAIFDDIGAILIIALFYTSKISLTALLMVVVFVIVLVILNKKGVTGKSPYLLVGAMMWVAMLKSGVHATLAGVVLAMFIPMRGEEENSSPLKELEHDLHQIVAFFILPVFAFANAGIPLIDVTAEQALHGVPVGIAAGLFLGKQLGIFLFCWLTIKLKWAPLPSGINFTGLYGAAVLAGVGFTMSLFIGSLAFEETGVNLLFDERLGIVTGSILSGVVGYFVIRWSLKAAKN